MKKHACILFDDVEAGTCDHQACKDMAQLRLKLADSESELKELRSVFCERCSIQRSQFIATVEGQFIAAVEAKLLSMRTTYQQNRHAQEWADFIEADEEIPALSAARASIIEAAKKKREAIKALGELSPASMAIGGMGDRIRELFRAAELADDALHRAVDALLILEEERKKA